MSLLHHSNKSRRHRVRLAPLFLLVCHGIVSHAFVAPATLPSKAVWHEKPLLHHRLQSQHFATRLSSSSVDTAALGKKRLAAGMGFLTGWADMVLNAKLATFCSMMTGNLLWFIKALADWRWRDGIYYASVLAAYAGGLAVYRKCQIHAKQEQRFLPTMAATVAILFVLADFLLIRSSSFIYVKLLPACFLSFAFALVNGVGNDTAGTPTFVITGHMTKMMTSIVDDRAADTHSSWKATMQRLLRQNGFRTQLSVFLGFGGGAILANVLRLQGIVNGQFASIGILFSGLFLWKDALAKGRPWFSRSTKSSTDDLVSATAMPLSAELEIPIDDEPDVLDNDLLNSSFASDLLPSLSAMPIDTTLDWISTTTLFNVTTPSAP